MRILRTCLLSIPLMMSLAAPGALAQEAEVRGGASIMTLPLLVNHRSCAQEPAGPLRGIQFAIWNGDCGPFVGARLAAFNVDSGVDAGISGAQLGIFNRTHYIKGAQIGLVNTASYARGVQMGLVNVTTELRGVQLGLFNLALGHKPVPFMILINVGIKEP